jgi:hypothetical protein
VPAADRWLGLGRIVDPTRRIHGAGAKQHFDFSQRLLDRRDHLEATVGW